LENQAQAVLINKGPGRRKRQIKGKTMIKGKNLTTRKTTVEETMSGKGSYFWKKYKRTGDALNTSY